ncbi:MAG: hypothetical protein GY754_29050 [bacterium]|nr:hypothetical protein [bacterium]
MKVYNFVNQQPYNKELHTGYGSIHSGSALKKASGGEDMVEISAEALQKYEQAKIFALDEKREEKRLVELAWDTIRKLDDSESTDEDATEILAALLFPEESTEK